MTKSTNAIYHCPNCGKVDWALAPQAKVAVMFLRRMCATTSRELADVMGTSIQNANNMLQRLVTSGYALRDETRYPAPGGGFYRIFLKTDKSL